MMRVELILKDDSTNGCITVNGDKVVEFVGSVIFVNPTKAIKGGELVALLADLVHALVRASGEVGHESD